MRFDKVRRWAGLFLMFKTVATEMGCWGGKVQAFNRVTVRASDERFRQSISKICFSKLKKCVNSNCKMY